jgi:hypothetical protein
MKAQRGEKHRVFLRCALDEINNRIYIDLSTHNWEYIEVTSAGWEQTKDVPLKFVRSGQMRALPTPVRDQRFTILQYLKVLINAVEQDDLILIAAWMLFALAGRGPFPILCFYGGPGTGKSTAGETAKECIDPSTPKAKMLPHQNEEQVMVTAVNGYCLLFDNVSTIAVWQSDALCRLSTGAGLGVRQHYSQRDEVVYEARRPILLTGIEQFVEPSDLADRTIAVELPALKDGKRITEVEHQRRLKKVSGKILGCLLDGLSVGLSRMPEIKINNLPRMADFALFATAAEPAFGWGAGSFLKAYQRNIKRNSSVVVESASIVPVIAELLDENGGKWEGTATELLKQIDNLVTYRGSGSLKIPPDWPSKPNKLSGLLRRLVGDLRRSGVNVDIEHRNSGSWISIHRLPRDDSDGR